MKQTPARLASRRTALGAGLAAAAIAVSIAVVPGRVSAVTDCVGGPEKSPAWLLLSDAAKSRICSGQQPVDPGVRPPEAQAYDEPWRVIAKAVAPDASAPSAQASAPAPSAWPRLADDEKTLVLMEEIRTPAPQRQPEMRLTTSETSGLPQVQVAGENFAPPRTILISCARGNRSVPLSSFVSGQRRNVASYDVDENVARMVHDERACRITVAGIAVPLPAELVAAVWSPTASN